MPYDRDTVKKLKEKGIFEDNVFDPNVLQLSEEEKAKIQRQIITKSLSEEEKKEFEFPQPKPPSKEVEVELTFLERVLAFILSFFGIMSLSDYKLKKAIYLIEKRLLKIKPPLYNHRSNKITKFFALKIYNIYTQLALIREIVRKTFDSPEWENPLQPRKTGVELLFEKLAGINSSVIDEKFSIQNITRVVSEIGGFKLAWEGIEEAVKKHFESITKESIDTANALYTNLIHLKKLSEYDFVQLLKRFDPDFSPKTTPSFADIPGEAIVPYLSELENSLIQIDFSIDNFTLIKKILEVSHFLSISGNENEDSLDEEIIDDQILSLVTVLKNFAYEQSLTMLIQIFTKDPAYSPIVLFSKYDLYKIYCDTFYKRIKFITEHIVKEKKLKEIEEVVKKVYNEIIWVGIYNPSYSHSLEERGLGNFEYIYHIGTINTFFELYFEDSIKKFLSLVLLNGLFADKFFQKTLSEVAYNLEKFEEKFRTFREDLSNEGNIGKKILGYLDRKEVTPNIKKTVERLIGNVNTSAIELFSEFFNIFILLEDCLGKLRKDIELHPPKYLRNIRSIGGSKNPKILSTLITDHETLKSLKEVFTFLKE